MAQLNYEYVQTLTRLVHRAGVTCNDHYSISIGGFRSLARFLTHSAVSHAFAFLPFFASSKSLCTYLSGNTSSAFRLNSMQKEYTAPSNGTRERICTALAMVFIWPWIQFLNVIAHPIVSGLRSPSGKKIESWRHSDIDSSKVRTRLTPTKQKN